MTSKAMKHSIVRPSPFVPLGNVSNGFAQAACAALDGENDAMLAELDDVIDSVAVVELPDGRVDTVESTDKLERVEIVRDTDMTNGEE